MTRCGARGGAATRRPEAPASTDAISRPLSLCQCHSQPRTDSLSPAPPASLLAFVRESASVPVPARGSCHLRSVRPCRDLFLDLAWRSTLHHSLSAICVPESLPAYIAPVAISQGGKPPAGIRSCTTPRTSSPCRRQTRLGASRVSSPTSRAGLGSALHATSRGLGLGQGSGVWSRYVCGSSGRYLTVNSIQVRSVHAEAPDENGMDRPEETEGC